jgi:hypothetical protein
MKPEPTADTLFDNAKAYTEAASRLVVDEGIEAAVAPAFYLLVSFAVELFLKSACMRAGATNEEVKRIGHDLHKAYLQAMEARQVPRYMTPFGQLTLYLNEPHRTHVFRYTPDGPPIEAPDPLYCLKVLKDVITYPETYRNTPLQLTSARLEV